MTDTIPPGTRQERIPAGRGQEVAAAGTHLPQFEPMVFPSGASAQAWRYIPHVCGLSPGECCDCA